MRKPGTFSHHITICEYVIEGNRISEISVSGKISNPVAFFIVQIIFRKLANLAQIDCGITEWFPEEGVSDARKADVGFM